MKVICRLEQLMWWKSWMFRGCVHTHMHIVSVKMSTDSSSSHFLPSFWAPYPTGWAQPRSKETMVSFFLSSCKVPWGFKHKSEMMRVDFMLVLANSRTKTDAWTPPALGQWLTLTLDGATWEGLPKDTWKIIKWWLQQNEVPVMGVRKGSSVIICVSKYSWSPVFYSVKKSP